jgi:hypothetical protein
VTSEKISYDKDDLRGIIKAFKAMDEEAVTQAKTVTSQLADFVKTKVVATASQRSKGQIAATRIAGARVAIAMHRRQV